jgi:protein-export membrane protein SecD
MACIVVAKSMLRAAACICFGGFLLLSAAHAAEPLLYQIDTAQIGKDWLQSLQFDARRALSEEKIAHNGVVIAENQVRVTLRDPGKMTVALPRLKRLAQPLPASLFGRWFAGRDFDLAVESDGNSIITIEPTAPGMQSRVDAALARSVEIIRQRIDPAGTEAAAVEAAGPERILVLAPRLASAEVKKRVETTAMLTFQFVDLSMLAKDAQVNGVPPDDLLLPEMKRPGRFVLVHKDAIVSGGDLVAAHGGYSGLAGGIGQLSVDFEFNSKSAVTFARATRENIGKPFAIILDNEVISTPVIRSEITDGRGQITGDFSPEEAERLALLLRSGPLPAVLSIVEQKSAAP